MKTKINKITAQEMGTLFGMAQNEIENGNNSTALDIAQGLEDRGYPDQAQMIRAEVKPEDPKCNHGATTKKTEMENKDPYGYWEITKLVCDHCSEVLDEDKRYIKTEPKPEPETPEDTTEPEPEPETPGLITPGQAKYWYSVAKKDISEGNIEGARNVQKWLRENNQKRYTNLLEKALEKAMPKPEPEPEPKPEPEPEPEDTTEPEPVIEGKLRARVNKKLYRAWIDPIMVLCDEMKVNITKTGLEVKLVDPAHVAMIETTIEKKAFEEYKANDFELGMDLDKLVSFLKKGDQKKDAWVSMDYDGDHNKTIWNNGINERTITNIDTAAMGDPKIPNLNLPNIITVDRKTLLEAIKEAGEVADYVRLISDSDGFTIDAEGDTDKTKAFIPKELLQYLDAKERQISLYSLDYLENMIKAIKADTVTLTMGTDYPVVINWEMDGIKSRYLLAPRIEAE